MAIKLDREEERERNSLSKVRRGFPRRFDINNLEERFAHAHSCNLSARGKH